MKKLIILAGLALSMGLTAQTGKSEAYYKSYVAENSFNYKGAITEIESVYDAKSYTDNLRLGWLYYLNKQYIKSKTFYEKAITLHPKSIEAKLGYINPLSALKNTAEVIKQYEKILVLAPKNTSVAYKLSSVYYLQKNYTKTIALNKTVLTLYPFDYYSNVLISKAYIKKGQIKEAKKHLNTALLASPKSLEVKKLLKTL